VGAVCGCAVLALVPPENTGIYPPCPTSALLGLDCPACGTLRGMHALLRGRPLDALGYNVLLAVAVPLGVLVWLAWVRHALGGAPLRRRMPPWTVAVVAVLAGAFAVVRNLPFAPLSWLAA
jgi:hypothetical protein